MPGAGVLDQIENWYRRKGCGGTKVDGHLVPVDRLTIMESYLETVRVHKVDSVDAAHLHYVPCGRTCVLVSAERVELVFRDQSGRETIIGNSLCVDKRALPTVSENPVEGGFHPEEPVLANHSTPVGHSAHCDPFACT